MRTGNTGRSPVAEQIARQALEDDAMGARARVYSRARSLGASTSIEPPVVAAAERKHFSLEIVQGLKMHKAVKFDANEAINAQLILTVDQNSKNEAISQLKSLTRLAPSLCARFSRPTSRRRSTTSSPSRIG